MKAPVETCTMDPVNNLKLKENKQGAFGLCYNDTVNLASKVNVHEGTRLN